MKRELSRIIALLFLALTAAGSAAASVLQRDDASATSAVGYEKKKAAGVWASVVTVDLSSSAIELRPLLVPHGTRATFKQMVDHSRPVAAINGTFFDPPSGVVLGHMVHAGKVVRSGWLGSAIRIDADGGTSMIPLKGRSGRHLDWTGAQFAVSSGPTLVESGRVALNPWAEGFTDPSVYAGARRSALGLTRANKLLMVTVVKPVSLRRMALVMQALGADRAINLDGGSSSGLYFRGSMLVKPTRSLTNAIGVFPRKP